jgi:OOP family OmpA-OmpF porin
MITNRTLGTTLFLVALFATASMANADPYRWYAGASYGASSFHHGVDDFSDGSISQGGIDDSDTGWKLFGGRRLSRHLSIELGYVDLNNDFDGETTLSGFSDGSGGHFREGPVSVDLDEPRAAVVALVGTLPLTKRALFLARAGAASWEVDRTTIDQSGRSTRAESGTDAAFGLGFQYRVTGRAELRVEWERYLGIATNDIDLGSIGMLVRLGR